MNPLVHDNIKAKFVDGIWLSNENIDNTINTNDFKYLGSKDNLQFLFSDVDKCSDVEYIVIDNNTDRHLFIALRKNIYRKDTNNYKIGFIQNKCRSFVYHFADVNKFIKFLHENGTTYISSVLNITAEDSAPKDL